jgi:hypothetical protein
MDSSPRTQLVCCRFLQQKIWTLQSFWTWHHKLKKLCGLNPRANYNDWEITACRRS